MKLQTQIVLPLVLTLALLGAAATGIVLQMGEDTALVEARGDLAGHAARAAQDTAGALRERTEGVALLAYMKTETDTATATLQLPPGEAERARAQLATLFREASGALFERVVVVGADGREAAAYAGGAEAAPDASRDHAASAEFRHLAADPLRPPVAFVADPAGARRLVAAAPYLDVEGRFGGIVRGEVPVAALQPASPGRGVAVALLGPDAAPLAGTAAALPPEAQGAVRQAAAAGGEARIAIAGGVLYAAQEAARLQGPGTEEPWVAVAYMPVAAATGPVQRPVLLLGGALVGIAAAAAIVGAAVVRRSLRPLERLSDAVGSLGSGPPAADVPAEGARELRTLADAFNRMVGRLADREQALAREVESRAQHAKDATIGSLSAGVAHEIKNPLTGMRLQTELQMRRVQQVLAEARDDETRAFAEAVQGMLDVNQRGIDRIEKVVSSLGLLARPMPALEAVELGPVAEASVALAGARLRGRGEVVLDIPPGLRAMATPDGVGQVLLNLVANASEVVPHGRGWIRVAAERRGDRVVLAVEDNGPGIAPEVAARLGEPFFTTKERGTGLGLTISTRIARELGGALRFSNRAEGGARFEVDLAAPPDAPRGDGARAAPTAAKREPGVGDAHREARAPPQPPARPEPGPAGAFGARSEKA